MIAEASDVMTILTSSPRWEWKVWGSQYLCLPRLVNLNCSKGILLIFALRFCITWLNIAFLLGNNKQGGTCWEMYGNVPYMDHLSCESKSTSQIPTKALLMEVEIAIPQWGGWHWDTLRFPNDSWNAILTTQGRTVAVTVTATEQQFQSPRNWSARPNTTPFWDGICCDELSA